MSDPAEPTELDLKKLKVLPLAERKSLAKIEDVLVEPADEPARCEPTVMTKIRECALKIREAKQRGAAVMVIYGAHLVKNGGQLLLNRMLDHGWLSHLATNG